MNPYFEKIKEEVAQRADAPVLEVLYRCYRELHPADSQAISGMFAQLNTVLEPLTLQDCDRVWDLTCALCTEHEREGFLEGVCVGTALTLELLHKIRAA